MKKTLKHRWSLRYLPLPGITAGSWWRLLSQTRFDLDWAYAHRSLLVTLGSVFNSLNAWLEKRQYGATIEATQIQEPPLFVLGHWRSGTTHLHNLLAQDLEQFAFPNTYQVVNPLTFLRTEAISTRLFARLLPSRRPMDNMELAFHLPQEDEFAMMQMTLLSPYLGIHLPRFMERFERYFSFERVPQTEVATWKQAALGFFKKVTYKSAGRALLLKSPPHTARIKLLLEMFPQARFVHIHRHPYEVYQSTCHYWRTAPWHSYLQVPDQEVDGGVLRRYNVLYDAFFSQRSLIPEGQFHEIRFADLERDPLGEVERVYRTLHLRGWERMRPRLERYVASISDYKKNQFVDLEPKAKAQVASAWQRSFQVWGYSP